MKRLEGKAALVTGAGRGIGRSIALCLAEEGADVLINDYLHADEAAEVIREIERTGRSALTWKADVADRGQMKEMVEAAVTHFGKLDIAVANAAYSVRQPVVEASVAYLK